MGSSVHEPTDGDKREAERSACETGGRPPISAGTLLYVANATANATVFSINQLTGALTPIAGSPFAAAGNPYGFVSVAINPAGTFAYMGTGNPGQLLSFGIDNVTGAMTFILDSSVSHSARRPEPAWIRAAR